MRTGLLTLLLLLFSGSVELSAQTPGEMEKDFARRQTELLSRTVINSIRRESAAAEMENRNRSSIYLSPGITLERLSIRSTRRRAEENAGASRNSSSSPSGVTAASQEAKVRAQLDSINGTVTTQTGFESGVGGDYLPGYCNYYPARTCLPREPGCSEILVRVDNHSGAGSLSALSKTDLVALLAYLESERRQLTEEWKILGEDAMRWGLIIKEPK